MTTDVYLNTEPPQPASVPQASDELEPTGPEQGVIVPDQGDMAPDQDIAQGATDEERFENALIQEIGTGPTDVLLADAGFWARAGKAVKGLKESLSGPAIKAPTVVRRPGFKVAPATRKEIEAYINANPDTIDLGNKTLAIEWSSLTDPAAIDGALKKIVSEGGERIDTARRGVQTEQKRYELARALGMTVEDVLKTPRGASMNAEEIEALKALTEANLRALVNAADQMLATPAHSQSYVRASQELSLKYSVASQLVEHLYGVRAEWGRAGQALQSTTDALASGSAVVFDIGDAIRRGAISPQDVHKLAVYLKTLPGLEEKSSFIWNLMRYGLQPAAGGIAGAEAGEKLGSTPEEKATYRTRGAVAGAAAGLVGGKVLAEVWYNAMLSGSGTHLANFASGYLTMVNAVLERSIAAGIGTSRAIGRGLVGIETPDRVYNSEVIEALDAIQGSQGDAIRAAWRTFRTRVSAFGDTKEVPEAAISSANLHLDGTAMGKFVDWLGTGITLPSRFLMTEDEYHKTVAYRIALRTLAQRRALAEGKRFEKAAQEVERLVKSPDMALHQEALAFAHDQTFTRQLEGRLLSAQHIMSHPSMRIVQPFFRTPINMARYTFERSPLGIFSKSVQSDLKAGGARRDMALAKMAYGSAILGLAGKLAESGIIIGRGPVEPNTRRLWLEGHEGDPSYSIDIGGGARIKFDRLDGAVGSLLAFMADYATMASYMKADELDEKAVAGYLAFSNSWASKSFLRDVSTVLTAALERDSADGFLKESARKVLRGTVPSAVAQYTRYTNPEIKEAFGLLDEVAARTPWGNPTLMPHRNLKGEVVTLPTGMDAETSLVVGTQASRKKDDPVWDELVKNGVSIEKPEKVFYGTNPGLVRDPDLKTGIPLTPKQYDDYVRWAGNELKVPTGQVGAALGLPEKAGMWDVLTGLTQSSIYKGWTPAKKKLKLTEVITKFRRVARQELLKQHADLRHQYVSKKIARAEAIEPEIGKLVDADTLNDLIDNLLEK